MRRKSALTRCRELGDEMAAMLAVLASTPGCGEEKIKAATALREKWRAAQESKAVANGRRGSRGQGAKS